LASTSSPKESIAQASNHIENQDLMAVIDQSEKSEHEEVKMMQTIDANHEGYNS
jgi:hypothetical protein